MDETLAEEIIQPDDSRIKKRPKGIPLHKIVELKQKNLTLEQIAQLLGCTKENVHARLKHVEDFEEFTKNPDVKFEVLQYRLYKSLTGDEIKRMQPFQRITGMAILEDKKRLIRGKSTENVNIFSLSASIADLEKKQAELLANADETDTDEKR